MLPIVLSILSALAPVGVDAGKALVNKYITPDEFKPSNIDEYTKMKQIELDLFNAVNNAGGNNPSYPWVDAVKQMQRPFVVIGVLTTWAIAHLSNGYNGATIDTGTIDAMASTMGFYLFGDRTLFYIKNRGK